jgi:hypothetical protein
MTGRIVGAYWGPRAEPLDQCSGRVLDLFQRIAQIDPQLSRWFLRADSRRQALEHEVKVSERSVRDLLLRGQNRRDVDRQVIPELGFSLGLWNGAPEGETASVDIHCGAYAAMPGAANSCVIGLPDSKGVDHVYDVTALPELIRAVARCFEPDWAVAATRNQMDELRTTAGAPFIGSHLFLSARRGLVPPLPPPAVAEQLDGHGTLIAVSERDDRGEWESVELARRVNGALTAARVLGPPPRGLRRLLPWT